VAGHNSRVRLNSTFANGYLEPPDDFGIGLVGAASGNLIDENVATGNTNGIYIAATVGANAVRDNRVIGNPVIQVGSAQPEVRALDIVNLSPTGRTTFQRNQCVTALNAPCSAVGPQ
jgi:parallel beta-helix repeat protein